METNLIWCPFCGSDEVTTDEPDVDGIFCQGCGFYWSFDGAGDYEVIRAETIACWNKRPVEDSLRAEIQRLRKENKALRNVASTSRDLIAAQQRAAQALYDPERPIRISRHEAMELPLETRSKVMARMTDALLDAMEVNNVPLNTIAQIPDANVEQFYREDE